MRRKSKRRKLEYRDIELNIMPFIDVFSLLNTFLLFSAVFLSIGIIEVQIPFLTNAPPPKQEKTRVFSVNVDVEPEKIELTTSWSAAPVNEQKQTFALNETGVAELHTKLIALRGQNQETDLITLFSEDDVTYEKLTMVLDSIKFLKEGDPVFREIDSNTKESRPSPFLYPKVVMGSVIL